jgi:hypothetical protein
MTRKQFFSLLHFSYGDCAQYDVSNSKFWKFKIPVILLYLELKKSRSGKVHLICKSLDMHMHCFNFKCVIGFDIYLLVYKSYSGTDDVHFFFVLLNLCFHWYKSSMGHLYEEDWVVFIFTFLCYLPCNFLNSVTNIWHFSLEWLLGVLHTVAWVKNTIWPHPCPSVCHVFPMGVGNLHDWGHCCATVATLGSRCATVGLDILLLKHIVWQWEEM